MHIVHLRNEANIYGHLVDSKREKDQINLVITPFNHCCYNVTNQSESDDLLLDMHVHTRTSSLPVTTRNLSAYISLCLDRDSPLPLLPTVPFPFFLTFSLAIKQTLLLLLFFLIFLLVNLMQSHLPSEIHTSSFYSHILLPYIIIPINKIGCFLLLFLYHSFIRFGSSSFCFVEDSNSCRHS